MHVHHILPKHMGGTDEPENLIACTIEEHANFHKELWEAHGHEWDRIAWLALSGQISVSEAKRMAQREGGRKGAAIVSAIRKEKGNDIGTWNKLTGNVLTIATPESCKKGGSVQGKRHVESGQWAKVRALGSIAGGKIAIKKLNATRWKCLDCGMVSSTGGIGNHQKAQGHQGKELCQS